MPAEARLNHERLTVEGKFFRLGGEAFFVRGLSYGPFDGEHGLPVEATVRRDLGSMAALGANLVRVYEPPPRWFLDACAEAGLRVLAGLAWESHVDFLRDRTGWGAIVERCRGAVAAVAGHPALAGWLVGNEVESALARWLRPGRVQRALEELIDTCRAEDVDVLYGYANYPSTEYLNPRNADFLAFNVYLEERAALERYAGRLQVLAGDRPVVVSEFGCDSEAKGEDGQGEVLGWALGAMRAAGLGGAVVFAFTDEWFRGGARVDGWRFGVVDAERGDKPAAAVVRGAFGEVWGAPDREAWPTVSVVVCTYNGTRTLCGCLESLRKLDYPEFEVVVVDDGSGTAVAEVVETFPEVRYVRQAHAGLSAARNRGADVASGEIVAYTDDDCVVDPGWLRWLVGAFDDEVVVAAGGPNMPPEPRNLAEACVGVAPGAPAHVLLDDRRAEHLPGCNLAVRKSALESVGGFRERYVAAGDDVDFCWRLADAGGEVVFVPNAMVWHHRRATVSAYLRQQVGYGKAEALLVGDHAERFGRFGGARWRGAVYGGGGPVSGVERGARIYHGVFGAAPFQFVYGGGGSSALDATGGFRWVIGWLVVAAVLAVVAWWWTWVPGFMLGVTVVRSVVAARRARPVARWDGYRARWLLFVLNLVQPVVRGWARWWGCLRRWSWPEGRAAKGRWRRAGRLGWWRKGAEVAYWSDDDVGRELLLGVLGGKLAGVSRMATTTGGPYDDYDYVMVGDYGGRVGVRTVTEYHGHGRCLTRVAVFEQERVWGWGVLLAAAGVSGWWAPLWLAAWAVVVLALVAVKWMRVQRVEELVGQAAEEVGLVGAER